MERKLVKQGRDALTITLPAHWLRSKGLRAGDCLEIEEQQESITLHAGKRSAREEITLDVRDLEASMVWHILIGKYIEGYDRFIVLHRHPALLQTFALQTIGMITEEHTATRSIVKSIIATPENDLDALLRRAGHMFLQQAVLLEELTRGKATLDDMKQQEILLDSTLYYCMRFLTKYGSKEHSYKFFLLCSTIEFAADQLTQLAKYLGNKESDRALATLIREHIALYVSYAFEKDLTRAYSSLRKFRNAIGTKQFAQGIAFVLAEALYNNIGYLLGTSER